jgi:hypothetical protein
MAARTHLAEHNGDPYRTSQCKATKEAKGPLWIPILEVWSDEAGPSASCRERPGTQFHDRSRRKRTHPKPANLSPHGKLGLLIQYEAGPDVGEDIKRETRVRIESFVLHKALHIPATLNVFTARCS